MLRSPQHLCRQGLIRSIGRLLPHEHTFPVRAQARLSPAFLPRNPRPRHFTISHPRRAEPSKPPTTAATTHPEHVSSSPLSQPSSLQARPRRRGLYYATLFLLFGIATGTVARITIAPPALPPRGSEQDVYLQSKIQAQGAALPIVQQLSADSAWTAWDAYSGVAATAETETTTTTTPPRITSGPMSGSPGLAFQRIFHNARTGEVVTVVYFGAAVAGFPGVVHGGALATVLDESLGRCAIFRFPSRTGVTANLEMQYRAPTLTNNFYVIRAVPVASPDDDLVGPDGVRKGDRKLWVRATLETEKGKVAVEAKGLFVVPKSYKLRPLVEGF
ncbi:HotDog domain-containing protein [Xylaria venustula]|nr:HotDog domain-containing protein [Xylaria venustula]